MARRSYWQRSAASSVLLAVLVTYRPTAFHVRAAPSCRRFYERARLNNTRLAIETQALLHKFCFGEDANMIVCDSAVAPLLELPPSRLTVADELNFLARFEEHPLRRAVKPTPWIAIGRPLPCVGGSAARSAGSSEAVVNFTACTEAELRRPDPVGTARAVFLQRSPPTTTSRTTRPPDHPTATPHPTPDAHRPLCDPPLTTHRLRSFHQRLLEREAVAQRTHKIVYNGTAAGGTAASSAALVRAKPKDERENYAYFFYSNQFQVYRKFSKVVDPTRSNAVAA